MTDDDDRPVPCQHCPLLIHQLPPSSSGVSGVWVDEFGLTVCQKAEMAFPASLMLHTPMPVIGDPK